MASELLAHSDMVLSILLNNGYITSRDLHSISCASKCTAAAVQSSLQRDGRNPLHNLLIAEASDAVQIGQYQQRQLQLAAQLVRWLLQQIGPEQQVFDAPTTGHSSLVWRLLHISNIPSIIAETLVAHGFRFTYQQLLSAASDIVQGPEAWVMAYKQLGVQLPEDMPQVIIDLLCEAPWAPEDTAALARHATSEQVPDIMALALVMGSATRNVVHGLVSLPVFHSIPPETLFKLLGTAMQVQDSRRVLALLQLPAAQELSLQQLLQLLDTAVSRNLSVSIRALCGLTEAAAQLTAAHVTRLLQLAVHLEGEGGVKVLCSLAPADDLDVDVLYDLMAAGIKDGNKVSALCRLSAAEQLSAAHAAALLQLALNSGSAEASRALAGLPAAQELQPGAVFDLLALAVKRSAGEFIALLCEFEATQQLPAQQCLHMLQVAIEQRSAATVVALGRLPSTHSSNHAAVMDILKDAGQTFNATEPAATLLAGFPEGQLPAAAVVWGLVQASADMGYLTSMRLAGMLAALTGAQQVISIDAGVIAQLLFIAVQLGSKYHAAVAALCSVTTAASISTSELYQLLVTAIDNADAGAIASSVAPLTKLPAAGQLSMQQVHELFNKCCSAQQLQQLASKWSV